MRGRDKGRDGMNEVAKRKRIKSVRGEKQLCMAEMGGEGYG